MAKFLFSFLFILSINTIKAQIGIGTNSPDSSAQLDVYSTSRGFLLPRMSTPQRKAIVNPAIGLLVFDTDKNSLYLYDGAKWTAVGSFADNDIPPYTRGLTQSQVNDHVGFSVAMDSNYAFIGAPLDSASGAGRQGAVYVMKKDMSTGWQFLAKLTASDVAAGDYFGYSVSIKGDYAVVGTRNSITNGAAYVFMRTGDTWTQQAKLTATDGAAGDMFGAAVCIYDNYVVVGAPKDDVGDSTDCGSAYIFSRTGAVWTQQAQITAADKTSNDEFGGAVTLHGNNLIICAPKDIINFEFEAPIQGSAYPYIRNGNVWTALRKLRQPPIGSRTYYAGAATVTSNYAVITGWYDKATTYRFADTGWIYESTLTVPSSYSSNIGTSACLSGEYLVIGGTPSVGIGSVAHVFCYKRIGNKWTLIKVINKIDATTSSSSLGWSVAIDGNSLDVLMGAPAGSISNNVSVKGAFYFTNLQ